jgi:hypothetical protein
MTPKQKALQLVDSFTMIDEFTTNGSKIYYHDSIKCALIAVDELLEATKRYDYTLGPNPSYNDYWLKVKYQIEHL